MTAIANFIFIALTTPFVLDAIILLFLLIMMIIGFKRKFWKSLFKFIFMGVVGVILYFTVLDIFASWIADDMFATFGFVQTIEATIGGNTISVEVHSLRELIETINSNLTSPYGAEYLNGLIMSFWKSLAWLVIVLLIVLTTWLISIPFWLFTKYIIIRSKAFKGANFRFFGVIFSLLQGVMIVLAFMLSTRAISPGFALLASSGKDSEGIINPFISATVGGLDPENSYILGWLEGIDVFTFDADGETHKVSEAEEEFFARLIERLEELTQEGFI